MFTSEFRIRDPFVLTLEGKYYLYGTNHPNGFDCRVSEDLIHFSDPIPAFRRPDGFWGTTGFWAPEVHLYKGAFYMLATCSAEPFHSECIRRGTMILRAEHPAGPFLPWSDGSITPKDWMCLDGTLYVENGRPYMVFCHEWLQIHDGTVCAVPLTDDLRAAAGEPVELFSAKSSGWAEPIDPEGVGYVTDGPFLWADEDGLWMFWSSFADKQYVEGIAFSKNGVLGPWEHREPLFSRDGGHGMVFRALDGGLRFVLHRPNQAPDERAVFFRLHKQNGIWSAEQE